MVVGKVWRRIAGIAAIAMLAACFERGYADAFDGDFRIWNEYKITEYSKDKWRTFTWAEARLVDDASRVGVWFLQQKAYRTLSDTLYLGLGASILDARNDEGGWDSQSRLELELNPRWRIAENSLVALRNRIELRSLERLNHAERIVSRHRITWARTRMKTSRLKRFEVSEELFFDFESGRLNESRFRPANLFFAIDRKTWGNVFAQIRSRRSLDDGDWDHAFILGFGLRMRPWR